VETHRGQLRAKLGLETRAELSAYAREHGLVH
jgi:DNA-binding CsgD family transcriptional regulator